MNMEILLLAISFAADKHGKQKRLGPSGKMYVTHPISVARRLIAAGAPDAAVVAAVLHDVVEDCGVDPAELLHFGYDIPGIVLEVTDAPGITDRAARKSAQVSKAESMGWEARMVKIADQIDNVHDMVFDAPVGWSDARRLEYIDLASKVVAACSKGYDKDFIVCDLAVAFIEMKRSAELLINAQKSIAEK